MRICIHRGSMQIGGTCVELESQGRCLVLDAGLPLGTKDPSAIPLPAVPGFDTPSASLMGVIISHPHQDHYGLIHRLPPKTPVFIGEAAWRMLQNVCFFAPRHGGITATGFLSDGVSMVLGPFTVTAHLVDHSAYDSYAVTVEADGKRVFYTGDIRAHGRKGRLFERLLRNPPADVNALLMEGTNLGSPEKPTASEEQLEWEMLRLFKQTAGMPLVWCSSMNIDRIVTVARACLRGGRRLLVDLYTAEMLRVTGNPRIPQGVWRSVGVFVPFAQRLRVKRAGRFDLVERYRANRVYPENLRALARRSVMLFRPALMRELEKADSLADARMVYSQWRGYLDDPSNADTLACLKRHDIPLVHCHTSGHAPVYDLKRLRNAFTTAYVVPIHTEAASAYDSYFTNVRHVRDGEWWEV